MKIPAESCLSVAINRAKAQKTACFSGGRGNYPFFMKPNSPVFRSSRSSGTRKAAAYTQPQLNTMLNKYNTMKPTDQGYDYYTETLADAGRIPRLSGTGNPGRSNGTAYEQGMYHARQWANGGYSQSQIASKLANETGLSNDLISSIMNQIDYEWRGTK